MSTETGMPAFLSIVMVIVRESGVSKIKDNDKKTELGAEERIPIFFFESPPPRAVIASDKTQISSTSKTCDMSDDPQLPLLVSVSPSSAKF